MATDTLQAGREAVDRHAWREAYETLSSADQAAPLNADDLDRLAESAWWIGRMRECIAARERAYAGYLAEGNRDRAARVAVDLADHHWDILEQSVAGAWLQQAQRLVEDDPDSAAAGHVSWMLGLMAWGSGDLDGAVELSARALEAGARHHDRDLMALALCLRGAVLITKGKADEGMRLLEEATVAAVSGELGARTTGGVYCIMIAQCAQLADYQRAGEWTEAAKRWCERQAISGFPGVCRVHRAEIMRLRGALADAEAEARTALDELRNFSLVFAGHAFYELGEIRMRIGDPTGAEEAFQQAHELGHVPQPGLAVLQLWQGKVDSAAASIRRALEEEATPLGRAKLLPAQVEIALAAGAVATARTSAEELEKIAAAYASAALMATSAAALGAVALAEGNREAALPRARRAVQLWRKVDAPYEAAKACILLAEVYASEGDRESATLELRTARSTLERLGAIPDAERAGQRLAELTAEVQRPSSTRVLRTFMFTDIVSSTNLVEAIGDEAWTDLIRWHDETLRRLIGSHGGEEVDHTGDGFFVSFPHVEGAVACAVGIQRKLTDHRREHGFAPQVRIGIHSTEATRVEENYRGRGVHEAARIGAVADGGEVLVSVSSLEGAMPCAPVSQPRELTLKGIAEPVRVAAVLWREA
jgi:class 3 adenylate cyclase